VELLVERCAGIDIGQAEVVVCARVPAVFESDLADGAGLIITVSFRPALTSPTLTSR
jgi:hypothetical protein